jgi:hypothetical protein
MADMDPRLGSTRVKERSQSLIGHSERFRCDYSRYPTSPAVQSKRMQVGSDHPEPEGWSNRPTTGPFFRSLPVTAVCATAGECRWQREYWSEHLLQDRGGRGSERTIEELLEFSEAAGAKKVLEWCSQHKNDPAPTQDDDADSSPCSEKSRNLSTFDLPCSEPLLAAVSRLLTTRRTQEDHRHRGVGPEVHAGRPRDAVRDHPRRQLHGYQGPP